MEKMLEYKDQYYSKQEKANADLTFYAAGHEKTSPGYPYGPIVRNYHVIHFVLKGKGTLVIANKEYQIEEGRAFIIPAQTPSYYKSDEKDPWEYCWISFLGMNSGKYISILQKNCFNSFVTSKLNTSVYKNLIVSFLNSSSTGTAKYLQSCGLVNDILGNLFMELNIEEDEEEVNHLEEIKYFIDMNIGKNITVNEIASHFGYHPNYLIRLFSQAFHISPKQYILKQKLEKAKFLIAHSNESINFIAQSLSFDDLSSFSRAFKRQFSISAKEFRSSLKKTDAINQF